MARRRKEYRSIIVIELPDNINLDLATKLLSNIHTNNKGCWVRGNDSMVYTNIKYDNKSQQAHRVSYEIFNKQKIPDHLFGCHRCDVKACINPNHIFIGGQSLNMQDAITKGRVFLPRIKKNRWSEYPMLRKLIKGY